LKSKGKRRTKGPKEGRLEQRGRKEILKMFIVNRISRKIEINTDLLI
jgi:hypothetical protein